MFALPSKFRIISKERFPIRTKTFFQCDTHLGRRSIVAEIAAVKTAQSELRADISKWGVVLFIGSMVAMTSIIGVFLASVVLTI